MGGHLTDILGGEDNVPPSSLLFSPMPDNDKTYANISPQLHSSYYVYQMYHLYITYYITIWFIYMICYCLGINVIDWSSMEMIYLYLYYTWIAVRLYIYILYILKYRGYIIIYNPTMWRRRLGVVKFHPRFGVSSWP